MTVSDREAVLEERFDLYRRHMRERAWYGAANYLAEIFHISAGLPVAQQAEWNTRIEKELSEEFLQKVSSGMNESIQRTHRILSIGTEWTGEEIMLVMQLRIEVKLLSDFLGTRVAVESQGQLNQIDDQLASLEKSKNHARHFSWGLKQMKKHWISDIESIWRSLVHAD